MRRAVDLDAAAERLLAWLRGRPQGWSSVSDHRLAQAAGLLSADDGMALLARLAARGVVEIERDGIATRRFQLRGVAVPPRVPITREMMAAAKATVPITPTSAIPHPTPPKEASVTDPLSALASFALSDNDKRWIRLAAKRADVPMSTFLRNAALAALAPPRDLAADEARLAPAIGRAAETARREGVDVWVLLGEVIDAGLTLRRACGREAVVS